MEKNNPSLITWSVSGMPYSVPMASGIKYVLETCFPKLK